MGESSCGVARGYGIGEHLDNKSLSEFSYSTHDFIDSIVLYGYNVYYKFATSVLEKSP